MVPKTCYCRSVRIMDFYETVPVVIFVAFALARWHRYGSQADKILPGIGRDVRSIVTGRTQQMAPICTPQVRHPFAAGVVDADGAVQPVAMYSSTSAFTIPGLCDG